MTLNKNRFEDDRQEVSAENGPPVGQQPPLSIPEDVRALLLEVERKRLLDQNKALEEYNERLIDEIRELLNHCVN